MQIFGALILFLILKVWSGSTSPTTKPTPVLGTAATPTEEVSPTSVPVTVTVTRAPTPIVRITVSVNGGGNGTSTSSEGDWIYPGSTKNGDKWNSSDEPKKITDWYKEKIKSMHLSAQSFVSTNTNDNVLNKLVAAGNNTKVSVEITKNAGDNASSILITLDNN